MKRTYAWLLTLALVLICCFILPMEADAATQGYYTYEVTDGKATITDTEWGLSGAVVVPETLGGYPVTAIGDWAFYDQTRMTSITLGKGITSIGKAAFSHCDALCAITFYYPDGFETAFSDNYQYPFGYFFEHGYDSDAYPVTQYCYDPDTGTRVEKRFYIPKTLGSVTVIGGSIPERAFQNYTRLSSITMENGVTSIGDAAFSNCTGLSSITLSEGITSIGEAFDGCSALSFNTYDNAKYLGSSQNPYFALIEAVSDSITSCDIHTNTKVISDSAFSGISSLYSVNIPEGVVTIGNSAFSCCRWLQSITVPSTVTNIGYWAFSSCERLRAVYITDLAAWCSIRFGDNPLYHAGKLYLNNQLVTDLVIPDGVTTIGASAFEYCTSLTTATIPDGVTTIGNWAFGSCSGLTSVTIPDGVTTIGNYAFYNCDSLTSVTIPGSVIAVGECAFSNCSNLTSATIGGSTISSSMFSGCNSLTSATIGNGITTIGDSAFSGCAGLTEITIPESVSAIGDKAFYNCAGLTGFYVHENNPAYCNDDRGVLFNKAKTVLLQVPCGISGSYTVPDSITAIGEGVFFGCRSLTELIIPDSVTTIAEGALGNCTSLESITIPFVGGNIETGYYSYQYPFGYIFGASGEGIKTTQYYYAYGDRLSATYYIPGSIRSVTVTGGYIPYGAFYNCSNLTSVTVPDGVTTIVEQAFYGCTSLEYNVYGNAKYLASTKTPYYVLIGAADNALTSCTVHEDTGVIYEGAFAQCNELRFVLMPASVVSIDRYAFNNCQNLGHVYYAGSQSQWNEIYIDSYNSALDDATIHYNTTMTGIRVVTRPTKQIYFVGEQLDTTGLQVSLEFSDNTLIALDSQSYSLKRYNSATPGTKEVFALYGEFYASFTVEVVEAITGTCGRNLTWSLKSDGALTVSGTGDMYNYSGTKVAPWEQRREYIRQVTLESGVTSVGSYAFYSCINLTDAALGDTVTVVGESAFSGCTALTAATIGESITRIGGSAFFGCCGLSEIVIPESVTTVGNSAFADCTGITASVVGSNIGNAVFSGCTGLTSVTLGKNVSSIGASAFSGCESLTDVYAADLNAWLGLSFRDETANPLRCNTLDKKLYLEGELATELVLPADSTELKTYALYRCASVRSVVIPDEIYVISPSAFEGCTGLETVYYTGTEIQWEDMIVGSNNKPLLDAEVICEFALTGDLDDTFGVSEDDAIYLLKYVLFPDMFPVRQAVDFDGSGSVDEGDALYLLMHVLLPDFFSIE